MSGEMIERVRTALERKGEESSLWLPFTVIRAIRHPDDPAVLAQISLYTISTTSIFLHLCYIFGHLRLRLSCRLARSLALGRSHERRKKKKKKGKKRKRRRTSE